MNLHPPPRPSAGSDVALPVPPTAPARPLQRGTAGWRILQGDPRGQPPAARPLPPRIPVRRGPPPPPRGSALFLSLIFSGFSIPPLGPLSSTLLPRQPGQPHQIQSRVSLPPRFPVIAGPTAGGKSDLAVEVAHLLGGPEGAEIITADSVQIFRGMDIGSAKPTPKERRGIAHHLIDVADPAGRYTVADWLAAADRAVTEIKARGRTPVVVGGTHLYIKAFLDGLFEGPAPDPALRESLRAMGLPALRRELERTDPSAAARIHHNDERRTVRALEVFRQTGVPISKLQRQWDRETGEGGGAEGGKGRPGCVLVGLDWPAELLNPRINSRVRRMVELGLVEEVRALHTAHLLGPQAREALGYNQIVRFLAGAWTLDEAIEAVKIETRRLAKAQRTWLRRLRATRGSFWIDAAEVPAGEWAQLVVRQCFTAQTGPAAGA